MPHESPVPEAEAPRDCPLCPRLVALRDELRGRHPDWIDLNNDRYPDLFIGNDEPRADDHTSPNRTYVNVGGTHFRQVNLGITKQDGSSCVQTVDVNHDGRDDLLLCGDKRTILYVRQGDRFPDRTRPRHGRGRAG